MGPLRDRPAYARERNAAHAKSAITDYFFTLAFGGERTKSVGQRAGKIGSLSAVHLPERLRKGDQRYSRNELRFQISRRRFGGLCRQGCTTGSTPAGQRMGPASYGQFQHSAPRRRRKQRGEKPISPAGKADHSFQGRKNARVQVCYAAKRGGFLQKQS